MDNLASHLQRIYDSEINVSISWFWDGGIDVTLGDGANAFVAEASLKEAKDILPWLQTQIRRHLPDSEFAREIAEVVK